MPEPCSSTSYQTHMLSKAQKSRLASIARGLPQLRHPSLGMLLALSMTSALSAAASAGSGLAR